MTQVVRGIAIAAAGQLAAELGADFISALRSADSFSVSQPHAGSVWISSSDGSWGTWEGMVVSCYYHPTKTHSATTVGKLGTKRSEAAAGTWAISKQTRGLGGNKAFYDTQ